MRTIEVRDIEIRDVRLVPYDEFRTGLTFAEVRRMLWSASDDPRDWRYKSRGVVLGTWHELKQQLYARYVDDLG
jgi:hypothetical protein